MIIGLTGYGTIIFGKDNGQPPVEVTDEMLNASVPLITFVEKELP